MTDILDKDRKNGLYVRISTSNQIEEGNSLDEQVQKLKDYCSYRGWKSSIVYRDEGFAGNDLVRPAFFRLVDDIQHGKINTVLVTKIETLLLSLMDFEYICKTFLEKGVDIISLNDNFDTSTAIGRSFVRMILNLIHLERKLIASQISKRTKRGLEGNAMSGIFNGGYARLGYDIDRKNKGLIPNKSEIPIVRQLFKTYIKLKSLSETANAMNAKGFRMKSWTTYQGKRGGKKFQKSSVLRLLKDPLYIGKVKYRNNLYDGKHRAIISRELFDSVQNILGESEGAIKIARI